MSKVKFARIQNVQTFTIDSIWDKDSRGLYSPHDVEDYEPRIASLFCLRSYILVAYGDNNEDLHITCYTKNKEGYKKFCSDFNNQFPDHWIQPEDDFITLSN